MVTTLGGSADNAFNAASHRRSGRASPARACSMITLAAVSAGVAVQPIACWRATIALSKAMPMRRMVSGSIDRPNRALLALWRKCIENFSPVKRDDATTPSTAG